jgi:hypothetical protein
LPTWRVSMRKGGVCGDVSVIPSPLLLEHYISDGGKSRMLEKHC